MKRHTELILVVDDNEKIISTLVDNYLQGYHTVAARNADQAWQIITGQFPDLILLDHQLPGTTGLTLFEQLRQADITTPVIMMTGYGSEELAVRAFRLGVQDYLIKPFNREQVLTAIDRALLPGRLERELKRRTQELTELTTIVQHVVETDELDQLLNRIVESAVNLTQASRGGLWLLDKESNELCLRADKNLGEIRPKVYRCQPQDNLLWQVIRDGRPIRRGKVAQLNRPLAVTLDYQVRSVLQVPLLTREKAIGVLSMQDSLGRPTFSQNDQERLFALANYAVIALRNAEKSKALLETQDRLAAAETVAQMGMFGSIWAHSVAQEISIIRNYLAVLRDSLPEGESQNFIAKVDEAAVAIQNIPIPAELPRKTNMVVPLSIDRTLKHQVSNHIIGRSDITLEFDLHCPEVQVLIDQSWLDIVIEILLRNSLRAMPRGGKVKISSIVREQWVDIDLVDSGCGIPEYQRPYFLKKRVPKQAGETGTGMGVLIAHYITSYFGGELALVESQPDQGTTMRVTLQITRHEQEQTLWPL